jgi:hypothetical protein
MPKKMVYLVRGHSGKYPEDSVDWNVKVFPTKKRAKNCAEKAETRGEEITRSCKKTGVISCRKNEYDPRMQISDGDAPSYTVESVEMED